LRHVAIDILDGSLQDVDLIQHRLEIPAGHHQLTFGQTELGTVLTRLIGPLAARLTAVSPRPTGPAGSCFDFSAAPPAPITRC